jgi:hypothetical protein
LTIKCQRSLIDVDNSDRRIVVISRPITLVSVERPFPNRDDERGVNDADFGDAQRSHYGNSENRRRSLQADACAPDLHRPCSRSCDLKPAIRFSIARRHEAMAFVLDR